MRHEKSCSKFSNYLNLVFSVALLKLKEDVCGILK